MSKFKKGDRVLSVRETFCDAKLGGVYEVDSVISGYGMILKGLDGVYATNSFELVTDGDAAASLDLRHNYDISWHCNADRLRPDTFFAGSIKSFDNLNETIDAIRQLISEGVTDVRITHTVTEK